MGEKKKRKEIATLQGAEKVFDGYKTHYFPESHKYELFNYKYIKFG